MAKIVAHTIDSARPGIEVSGDLLMEIHDDDVELSGPGYALFEVIQITGFTKEVIRDYLVNMIPEIKTAQRLNQRLTFGFTDIVEKKEVWDSNGIWNELVNKPKLILNIQLTQQQKDDLANESIDNVTKRGIIDTTVVEKLHLNELNMVPVSDLNG